jgi:tetratricopeptide (TPR) repeat protein
MLWRFLLLLSVFSACSRGPSTGRAYSDAWTAFREAKLQQAQQIVDAALKTHAKERPGDAVEPLLLLQTEILLARGQPRTAWELLGKCPDSPNQELHLRWLADRADALIKLGQADKAKALLDEVDRTAGSKGTGEWVFKGLLMRGAMLARERQFDQAENVLKGLLARTIAAGDVNNQAGALLNLSYSKIRQSRYDESIEYSASALDFAQKSRAFRIVAIANNNLGQAYTALGDLDRAADHQNKAISQIREIDDLRSLEDTLGGLGNIYLLAHKPALAAQAFEEAVDIAKRSDATADALRWAHRAAFAMIEQQNWDAAEAWNRQAYALREQLPGPDNGLFLKLNAAAIAAGRGNSQEAERLYRETIAESKDAPYSEWVAHVRLGPLLAKGRQFPAANAEYKLGLQSIERVQSSMKDEYRFSYQDLQMQFFKDYVELLVSEGDTKTALQVAEYSRARVLAEKLGKPTDAIDEVNPADFQRYANQTGSVLLSYWLAPQRSFVWVIKPGKNIRMRELPSASEIAELIRKYGYAIDEEQSDPVEKHSLLAQQLGTMVLGPIRGDLANVRKVVIVPDGQLHALNLETLPAPGNENRYWIEDDVEISIAPSLKVLRVSHPTQPKNGSNQSLLLIGAPVSASAEYPELRAAKLEIDGIHKHFPGAKVHEGSDASPFAKPCPPSSP